jgi:hypothetical protein
MGGEEMRSEKLVIGESEENDERNKGCLSK